MSDSENPTENDTLTFVNEEMTYQEVKSIFECYGEIRNLNKYRRRFFVQFETPEQAAKAEFELRKKLKVTYAHAKTRPRPKKNFRAEGELIKLYFDPNDSSNTGKKLARDSYFAKTRLTPMTPGRGRCSNDIILCPLPRGFSSGMAMMQDYGKTTSRGYKYPDSPGRALGKRQNAKGNIRGYESRSEYDRELENREEKAKRPQNGGETDEDSEKQSQRTVKQDQSGKSVKLKPSTSELPDPEYDSDDDIEEPKAGKPEPEKCSPEESEEDEYLEVTEDEDDFEAQVRALSDNGRRRVITEGVDEIMNALGNDTFSVIVANIPAKYTLNEVYDLVEEVKPIAFSEMDYSIKMRVKFCEVFVNDAADVDYLKQKLNDFVICGKQLTVMEPAEILDETRWNA